MKGGPLKQLSRLRSAVTERCLERCAEVAYSLIISAVAAHYSPPPASQTIKLGKTPLGIILNNSCYSDGVQTPCFHGLQKMHIFALHTSPRTN